MGKRMILGVNFNEWTYDYKLLLRRVSIRQHTRSKPTQKLELNLGSTSTVKYVVNVHTRCDVCSSY